MRLTALFYFYFLSPLGKWFFNTPFTALPQPTGNPSTHTKHQPFSAFSQSKVSPRRYFSTRTSVCDKCKTFLHSELFKHIANECEGSNRPFFTSPSRTPTRKTCKPFQSNTPSGSSYNMPFTSCKRKANRSLKSCFSNARNAFCPSCVTLTRPSFKRVSHSSTRACFSNNATKCPSPSTLCG